MKKIVILAMKNAMASTIAGPMDVLAQAGQMYNFFMKKPLTPFFQVKVVTSNGQPFKCLNGMKIMPDGTIHDVDQPDLILISSILDIDKTLREQGEVVDWLTQCHCRGIHIGSICSGAFVLAETGLLNGRTATTHWALAHQFRARYPQVRLKPEHLVIDHGDLYCAGGFNAGTDLALHLVRKFISPQVAVETAKAIVHDSGRRSQKPYFIFDVPRAHEDDAILAAQNWIEENFRGNFSYDDLARTALLGRRTLERRFKKATGLTPRLYLQHLRVEAAKHCLETKHLSFQEITSHVGYDDPSAFRKIFLRLTGFNPGEYRQRFGPDLPGKRRGQD